MAQIDLEKGLDRVRQILAKVKRSAEYLDSPASELAGDEEQIYLLLAAPALAESVIAALDYVACMSHDLDECRRCEITYEIVKPLLTGWDKNEYD